MRIVTIDNGPVDDYRTNTNEHMRKQCQIFAIVRPCMEHVYGYTVHYVVYIISNRKGGEKKTDDKTIATVYTHSN